MGTWIDTIMAVSFLSVGGGLSVCGHRGRAPLFSSLPRRRSPRKARRRRLVLALRGVRRCGIPRPVGGRSPSFPLAGWPLLLPAGGALLALLHCFRGANSGQPCPHSDKSGGEGGTHCLAFCTAWPGGGRACLPEGQRLPCWGLCEAQRAEHRPQHCPARRRMTAPLRGPEFRLTLLGARCCPPAGGLLSGPQYKRGLATGGSVGPQRTRGVEGGHWLGCRACRAATQRSDAGSEVGRVWGVTQQQQRAQQHRAQHRGPWLGCGC